MIGAKFVTGAIVALTAFAPPAGSDLPAQSPGNCTTCICGGTGTGTYDGALPTVLYRVDDRPPTNQALTGIFETGFTARGQGIDLVRHVIREGEGLQSGYVSTTDSADVALRIAQTRFNNDPSAGTQWIYTIRATESFHNVEQSLWTRQDRVPIGSDDYNRIGHAIQTAAYQAEWVTADPIPSSVIVRAHEVTRADPRFNPDSPHLTANDNYRGATTSASCRLI